MGRKSSKTEDRLALRDGESDDEDLVEESEDEADAEADADADADAQSASDSETDNVGEVSVEINVEDLIKELEGSGRASPSGDMNSARRKLEDYLEERRIARDVLDFEDYDLDD